MLYFYIYNNLLNGLFFVLIISNFYKGTYWSSTNPIIEANEQLENSHGLLSLPVPANPSEGAPPTAAIILKSLSSQLAVSWFEFMLK